MPVGATAATFVVTTTADGGPGSLRAAVLDANAAGGSNTIQVGSGTYTLTLDPFQFEITSGDNVTITGAGAGSTIIDAAGRGRAFQVDTGSSLTLTGMTVQNGSVGNIRPAASPRVGPHATAPACPAPEEGEVDGGAILQNGPLTLTDDAFTGNLANGSGGAIEDNGGALTVSGSTFSDNVSCRGFSAPGTTGLPAGGAIFESSGAPVTIDSSTFTSNSAASAGGGVSEEGGATLTVTNSTFTGNTALSGGAIDGECGVAACGTVDLFGDALTGNTAAPSGESGSAGGALYDTGETHYDVVNTTITGNTATDGGGIASANGIVNLSFSTVDGNSIIPGPLGTAGPASAANLENTDSGSFTLDDTILANGILVGGAGAFPAGTTTDCSPATVTSNGNNLFDTSGADCGAVGSDLINTDPMLGTLSNNGGPTQTLPVQTGSPAINAASASRCRSETVNTSGTAVDQRGVLRPQFPTCTIGAYEYENANMAVTASADPATIPVGGTTTVTDTITNQSGTGGYSTAPNVMFTDPASGSFTITSATPSQGTCTHTSTTVTCSLGTMPLGSNATVQIGLTGSAPGVLVLNSHVSSGLPDPNLVNNAAATDVTVVPASTTGPTGTSGTTGPTGTTGPPTPTPTAEADLGVTQRVSHATVTVGHTTTFTLKVTNHGPNTDSSVVLTDKLPSGGVQWVSTKPARGTCSGHVEIRCELGTLKVGASVTVEVTVKATKIGTFVSAGHVTGKLHDPKLSNNHALKTVAAQLPPCVENLKFTTNWNPQLNVTKVQVIVDGHLVRTLHGSNLRTITITSVPTTGTHNVTVAFIISPTQTVTASRTYTDCASGPTTYAYPPLTNPGAS